MSTIKGSCGDRNFGFYWFETERSKDNSFIYGQFQIIVANNELLKSEYEIAYDINIIARYFKKDLKHIRKREITFSNDSKDDLYLRAERSRGDYTYLEYEQLNNGTKTEKQIDIELLKYKSAKPFGYRFNLYYDIEDQGFAFYLFRNRNKDRLIYCSNSSFEENGKTVYEVQLELGTVERVLSELPDL